MKFRILHGQHIAGKDENGKRIVYRGADGKGHSGDVFESEFDLVARFNDPRMEQQKFERVFHEDPLDSMTVKQLRQLAEDEEIDLGSATAKNDILRIVRGSKAAV